MSEKVEKEKVAENQKEILNSYFQRVGISNSDEHAQRILAKISSFQITTFREEKIKKMDGQLEIITLADVNSGNLDTGTFRGLFSKSPDRTLFNDMVALGFTLSIFDKEPATTSTFNGLWRGDGLPQTR